MTTRLALTLIGSTLLLALAGCGGDDDGGEAAHPLGEEVVVEHTQGTTAGAPRATVGITVQKVRQGTQADLEQAGFSLDPEEKTATPYYVDVRYANKGSAAIDRGLVVSLEDGDGNTISSTTIINLGGEPFAKCPQAERGKLAPGQSYEDCRLFLVPEGREPERVTFLPYNPDEPTDFVRWTVP